MGDQERYRIERVAEDGTPTAPPGVKNKMVKQCGVLVRDFIPITVREWHQPKEKGLLYVSEKGKERLWRKLMVNFTLPAPEVDSDEEDPDEAEKIARKIMEQKVKDWALKKMAELFKNWKKRLNNLFVKKNKTPDFDKGYEKIKDYWEEFVAYKKSKEALQISAQNAANAALKMYHHTMGPGGYAHNIPKWEKLEAEYLAKGITPEPHTWTERARNWFYGHGGTLDAEGKCIYNRRHKDNPLLPIEDIRNAFKDVEEGRFIPDREDDELTRALGNKEHDGRLRGVIGSKPKTIAIPEHRKKFPDRSHQRRKEREAMEARAAADRLRNIEEELKLHKEQLDALSQQGTTGQSQRHMVEAACDGTGGPSNRKSSVASTELQDGNDDAVAPLRRYPVDDITESTPCELHLKVYNLSMKVAVGYALPIGPNPTYHFAPVPNGYAVVGVDAVMKDFEELKLHHPAGEDGDVLELGEAKKASILWPKESIVLPNWQPRPSTPQHSPAQRSSSPPQHSPAQPSSSPPHKSPAQPSPPPRDQSPAQPSQQKKRNNAAPPLRTQKRGRTQKIVDIPSVPPKRPYDRTEAENAEVVAAYNKAFFAPKKPEPKMVYDEKAKKWAKSFLDGPSQISMNLPSDYGRELKRLARAQSEQNKGRSAKSGKQIPQLGQQKNQSVAPLIVCSDVDKDFNAAMDQDLELLDRRALAAAKELGITVSQAKENATAMGMSLGQLLGYESAPMLEMARKYVQGEPMVSNVELAGLSTHMRNLHTWYLLHTSKKGAKEWFPVDVRVDHFFKPYIIQVQLTELFQLFQKRDLDKSILSCYCL